MTFHAITVRSLPINQALQARQVVQHLDLAIQFSRIVKSANALPRPSVTRNPMRALRVRGTVLIDPDIPAARMVYLYDESDYMLTARARSHPITGAFEFLELFGGRTYLAVAKDNTGEYRAEAHDGLVPEPMA
ncbi:MAG: hypothetical protein ACK4OE_08935 [Acidovorax sp.]|uniref:hypothetical protein n=1 Tax=Acidovorax sp. TaxID=1872122 RepID=UPI00391D9908